MRARPITKICTPLGAAERVDTGKRWPPRRHRPIVRPRVDSTGFGRRFRVRINLRPSVLRREARGILIALLLVAVTTAVLFFLRHYFGILRGAVLYLVPVMIAGYQLGTIPALVTAVAGVILSGYLYFSPLYSFRVASPQEAVNLLLFMVVAVVVSHLSNQAKKHTMIAQKREREMSDLYAFSRRLSAAQSTGEIFTAIQNHLANLVQRK